MSDGWVRVLSVGNTYEAELAAGRLREEGVEARIAKGRGAPGVWLTGSENPFGPVDVYVAAADVPAARRHLGEAPAAETEPPEARRRSPVHVAAGVVVVASIVVTVVVAVADLVN